MIFNHFLHSRNFELTGRAATAIYLILKAQGIHSRRVLVPANICYAAVFPILYSGNVPCFVDIGEDGNLEVSTLKSHCEGDVAAIIVPHMYGNPCQDIEAIAHLCKERNILMIEDCALALGATIRGQSAGSFGDYAIYSFGYSKMIDLEYGGLILSHHDLGQIAFLNKQLPVYNEKIERDIKLFSGLYRAVRTREDSPMTAHIYKAAADYFQVIFIFQCDPLQREKILNALSSVEKAVCKRREMWAWIRDQIEESDLLKIYPFHEGAVPWRFNVLLNPEIKPRVVEALLSEHIPVSDWYPPMTKMFAVKERFPRAEEMGRKIINFPLIDIDDLRVRRFCNNMNELPSHFESSRS